jgi:hypothetical protein
MYKPVNCITNKKETKKLSIYVLAILTLAATMLLTACSEDTTNAPDDSQARPYDLFGKSDHNVAGRDRREFKIYSPGSVSIDERAYTAMNAALYFQKGTEAQVISVRLYHSKDPADPELLLALVDYAPDGGGNSGNDGWTWKVKAASERVSPLEILINKSWEANKHKFIEADGLINEKELTSFIANQLNIPVDRVKLPVVNTKAYTPVFN